MSLDRELVEVGRTQFNEPVICCAHCHRAADHAQTIDESSAMSYTIVCPAPEVGGPSHHRFMGQRRTAGARDN
jgi:hypothetical protein